MGGRRPIRSGKRSQTRARTATRSTVAAADAIRRLLAGGWTKCGLARETGLTRSTLVLIVNQRVLRVHSGTLARLRAVETGGVAPAHSGPGTNTDTANGPKEEV
uniref:Uncharacterized protein n=1 Tax=viral metagenome TaxID=1070528 RepID=A0A6M3LSE2_9ZZZZ